MLHHSDDPLWDLIRFEGRVAARQSRVSSLLHNSILGRSNLEDAIGSDVANKMGTTFLGATEITTLMAEMFENNPRQILVISEDILAHAMRDSSIPDVLTILLFHKGFNALVTHRLMHWLWVNGRQTLARYMQAVCSEICAADLHPAAKIGKGIFLSGGCDIVIGETAVVGDDVCILQGVTLGGTGKDRGNRHPKVARGVHIGAGSSVLGNIPIGEGSRIEASTVVVKPVEPYQVHRGVPSKPVSYVVCDPDSMSLQETIAGHRMIFISYQSRYLGM